MEHTLDIRDGAIVFQVSGRVDESTWTAFGEALGDAVRQAREAGLAEVVIDLSSLDYMSSRGLRVLTVAKREADEAGIGLRLAAPNDVMREILAISRYDKLFTVTDRVEMKQ